MDTPTPNIEEVVVLTRAQYEKLENQLPAPVPSSNTTDIQAGYQLGIQHVLKLLRQGFVMR